MAADHGRAPGRSAGRQSGRWKVDSTEADADPWLQPICNAVSDTAENAGNSHTTIRRRLPMMSPADAPKAALLPRQLLEEFELRSSAYDAENRF